MAEKITQTTIDKIKNIKPKTTTPKQVKKPQTQQVTEPITKPEALKEKKPAYSYHIKMTHHYSMFYKPDYTYTTSHVDPMLTFNKLKNILKTNKWRDVESYEIDEKNQYILIKRKNCKQYYEEITIHVTNAPQKSNNNPSGKKEEDVRHKSIEQTLKFWNPKVKN